MFSNQKLKSQMVKQDYSKHLSIEELKELILLLRYRNINPIMTSYSYMSLGSIS
jgi:hypothetical protein